MKQKRDKPDFSHLRPILGTGGKFISTIFPFGSSQLVFKTYDDYTHPNGQRRRNWKRVKKLTNNLNNVAKQLNELNRKGAGIFLIPNLFEIRVIFADDNIIREKPRNDWPIPPSIIIETSKGRFIYLWILNYTTSMAIETFLGINRRLVRDWGHNKFSMGANSSIRVPGTFNCKTIDAFPCEIVGGTGKMVSEDEVVEAFPPLPPLRGNPFDKKNGKLSSSAGSRTSASSSAPERGRT